MSERKKLISIVMPCYNEAGNVREAYSRIKDIFAALPQYDYEHIFIDNASSDETVEILKEIARADKRLKIIVNARNFGHIRSPYHAYFQAKGDAVVAIVSDLQEPPELILDFLKKWEEGFKIVVAIKAQSNEAPLMFYTRKLYYYWLNKLSEVKLLQNFSGFGLYDRSVIGILGKMDDHYPYFRGLICEIGYKRAEVYYHQASRKRGFTKNNFYSLFDNALLGLINHSRVPLRMATIVGFSSSIIGFLVAIGYLIYKLFNWYSFSVGIAPLVIGIYFWSSLQIFFLGVLGEYIISIQRQLFKRPVVELERINFDE